MQSRYPSHTQLFMMQAPLLQRKWLGKHIAGADVVKGSICEPKNKPVSADLTECVPRFDCVLKAFSVPRRPKGKIPGYQLEKEERGEYITSAIFLF